MRVVTVTQIETDCDREMVKVSSEKKLTELVQCSQNMSEVL